ncbi:hypothetical protein Y603_4974 [Burkholderia pseudomallei MSHR1153]|nr:hypothetical protein Y603_4974 [Burkholderia pseudomallei MSHR1153]
MAYRRMIRFFRMHLMRYARSDNQIETSDYGVRF